MPAGILREDEKEIGAMSPGDKETVETEYSIII